MKMSLFLTITAVCLHAAVPPKPMRFSLQSSVLDLNGSVAQPGHVRAPQSETSVNIEITDWRTAPTNQPHSGEFLLKLRRPTLLGSLIAYEPGTVNYSVSNEWTVLAAENEAGRKLQVLAFPPDKRVQAIKFSIPAVPQSGGPDAEKRYQATLSFATLVPIRVNNIASQARVTASSTNQVKPPSPSLCEPQTLVDGIIHRQHNFATAARTKPASADSPEYILLTWGETETFRGLAIFQGSEDPGLGDFVIESFIGAGDPSPNQGTDAWRPLQCRLTSPGLFCRNQFFVFPEDVATRALRLSPAEGVTQAGCGEIAVLSALASNQPTSRDIYLPLVNPLPQPPAKPPEARRLHE